MKVLVRRRGIAKKYSCLSSGPPKLIKTGCLVVNCKNCFIERIPWFICSFKHVYSQPNSCEENIIFPVNTNLKLQV